MGLDFLDVERVARITHHGLGFVRAFELALAVNAEAHGRLLRGQPVRHGGLGAGLRADERYRQAGQ